jgi:hypothetical protein
MSLKAFHLFFITVAIALAFGCGAWGLKGYVSAGGNAGDLGFAIGSFVVGVGLIFYECYVLKEFKNKDIE